MKTFLSGIFTSILLLSNQSFAYDFENPSNQIIKKSFDRSEFKLGGWSSGGGNAIVCFKEKAQAEGIRNNQGIIPDNYINSITSIEMYDLYSAKIPRGIDNPVTPEIYSIKSDETINEYVERMGNRYNGYLYDVYQVVKDGMKSFSDGDVNWHNTPIKQQNDIGGITHISNGHCTISTMALQRNWSNYHELHIDKRLFNHPKHSRLSKAVLILHEYVYSIGRNKGHEDSSQTRKLVEYLISKNTNVIRGAQLVMNLNFKMRDFSYEKSKLNRTRFPYIIHTGVGFYAMSMGPAILTSEARDILEKETEQTVQLANALNENDPQAQIPGNILDITDYVNANSDKIPGSLFSQYLKVKIAVDQSVVDHLNLIEKREVEAITNFYSYINKFIIKTIYEKVKEHTFKKLYDKTEQGKWFIREFTQFDIHNYTNDKFIAFTIDSADELYSDLRILHSSLLSITIK